MTEQIRPLLGISMGDPAGVGPEVTAKALADPRVAAVCRPLVVGDAGVMQKAVKDCGLGLAINALGEVDKARFQTNAIDVLDLKNLPLDQLRVGAETPAQGLASFQYIERNIKLAMAGEIDGTVTGPINKAALNAAGLHYAGHTEIYATLTGTKDYCMMLAEGSFRVAHVSTHVSLRVACDRVKTARVLRVIQLTHEALVNMGLETPRIAVAGLNPHCGEGGLFGDEEINEIQPALDQALAQGLGVVGPIPADTVFSKMAGGMYDAVVVMYHDQGHIPTKLVGFKYDQATGTWQAMAGVNLTLGLPIVRTSVDHGTAFDIAGMNQANPQSMIEAIELAARLATGRMRGAHA